MTMVYANKSLVCFMCHVTAKPNLVCEIPLIPQIEFVFKIGVAKVIYFVRVRTRR